MNAHEQASIIRPVDERARGAGARTSGLSIALVGNHLPRLCGIATFTGDLATALRALPGTRDCFVVALTEPAHRGAYPAPVRFEIALDDVASYERAARALGGADADVISLQHEYGIFGGPAGEHVLAFLRAADRPTVTTLHTILMSPNPRQRAVMDELTRLSTRLVVMTERAREVLAWVHRVPREKIDVIPHGIAALHPRPFAKQELGLAGREVLLTFGLMSPSKGIEHAIDALPAILERSPSVVYVVAGTTHPHVRLHSGETYRRMLEERAVSRGVQDHVHFLDRFVEPEELARLMAAADVYLTPYLEGEQASSGTLAYAVGSGKAAVSTPYAYARELLAGGRGALVPFRDPAALAEAVTAILRDGVTRVGFERSAERLGRAMRWPVVARAYARSFARARVVGRARGGEAPAHQVVKLGHLRAMTDDVGLFQHAVFDLPRYEDGYCLDDNARALLLIAELAAAQLAPRAVLRSLGRRYLAFVWNAYASSTGRFRNFLSFDRRFELGPGSEDCHGRALWALGVTSSLANGTDRAGLAAQMLWAGLPATSSFTSPRAWAYTLLGLDAFLRRHGSADVVATRADLAGRLVARFDACASDDWPWFEDAATYCNARLPQALILTGEALRDRAMIERGLKALDWLARMQTAPEGWFSPVGTDGFHARGGTVAAFDQQPVEASSMVSACLTAHAVTRDRRWLGEAWRAWSWFLGANHLGVVLFDEDGGCRDALHRDRPNENRGAESTLSYLLALVDMQAAPPERDA